MYIFESRLVNIPEELQNENRPLPLAETLLFTQDSKPQVKSTYACPPMEELIEKQGQPLYDLADEMVDSFAASGGSVVSNINADIDGGNGLTLEYTVASNAYMSNLLQPIELPTVDLDNIVFIPYAVAAGDMPYVINKKYDGKINYSYYEVE